MADDAILNHILAMEGGFVDHPHDKGGATNFGVTATTLGRWLKLPGPASIDQVRALSIDVAKAIYRTEYIANPGFGPIADGVLKLFVVDAAVLHGPGRAARWLQSAAGVAIDGAIGPVTITAVNAAPPGTLAKTFLALRFREIGRILNNDHSQVVFAAGWINRLSGLIAKL
jgi:lysozyme family protein